MIEIVLKLADDQVVPAHLHLGPPIVEPLEWKPAHCIGQGTA